MNELALFNRLFDNFGDYGYSATPSVDVKENKENYTLEMDLPGKTEKDINIELNKNVLTVSSEKETKKEEKSDKKDESKWLIRERSYSSFSRSFTLPEDIDSEKLSATVKNGILTVVMPRKALAAPRRIAITCA